MNLVTGAAGKTGRAVIQALARRGQAIRGLAHRPEQVEPLQALGAHEVATGDLRAEATVARAMHGIRAVYHICPNMSPEEISIGQVAMRAARAAGVELFVYHSVLHPQVEAMPHHWLKMRVEEQLFESGLPYTILQPAAYMQNVLAHWERIATEGIYPVPYPAETRLSMVDLEDVAEAAAAVLTEPGHVGAIYELAGPGALTQTEVARVLSQQLGRTVVAEVVPLDVWRQQAQSSGLGDYALDTLQAMFRYYGRYGFVGNSNVLGTLLDRPPTGFAAFVAREIQERIESARGG
ncbi:MAG: NmrA family NAD(P)-binding protein [Anaerolineae bacterium]|jgi:uncharacterized protein YbjT (DUF2867 family)